MVPFLYVLYGRLSVPPATATVLAHATSLMVIVPTAARALAGYRGTGLVQWRSALPLAVVAGVAAVFMAGLAPRLPAAALRIGFGVFLVAVAGELLLRRGDHAELPVRGTSHLVLASLLGLPIGALSAALGVGGGVPATVAMHHLLKLPFRYLIPTSLVVVGLVAAAATVRYALTETPGLGFGGVIGHVDLLHGAPLAAGAVLAAPLGVALNKRLPVLVLRRGFGVLLLAIGMRLVWENL